MDKNNHNMSLTLEWNEFENNNTNRRIKVIGYPNTLSEAFSLIREFLKQHNYKCYAIRQWLKENRVVIDVGSHSQLFYISNLNEVTKQELIKEGLIKNEN